MGGTNGGCLVATCVRKAWLTLGALSVQLEDETAGYFCQSLDLGWPDVRAVTNNRPDADGVDDRTRLMGSRPITAAITALESAGVAKIDDVASSFAPFMVPSARPVLHYVLDRSGATERTLTLRAAGYAWPIAGPFERDIQLQWIAADPVARDPNAQTVVAWAGTGILGRVYSWTPPRAYPVGAGLPTVGHIVGHGDVPIQPYVRIFGPITNPRVTFDTVGPPVVHSEIGMTYRIDAGHFVGIDTRAHTAYLDDNTAASVLSALNWSTLVWPTLPNSPDSTSMAITGTGTTSSSQVAATWNDGYLT